MPAVVAFSAPTTTVLSLAGSDSVHKRCAESTLAEMNVDRFNRMREVLDRRQPDLTVLMEEVNKPHNLSAILRNCDAVGVLEIHTVSPNEPLRLDHVTSAGTKKWIRVRRHDDALDALGTLRAAGMRVIAANPGPGSLDFREADYTRPTALVVGAELYGISPPVLAAADLRVHIPMAGMARSLNVSVATSLLLYEAFRQRERAGLYRRSRLDTESHARLLFEWAYPELADLCREQGQPYPAIGPDGEIVGSLEGILGDRSSPSGGLHGHGGP